MRHYPVLYVIVGIIAFGVLVWVADDRFMDPSLPAETLEDQFSKVIERKTQEDRLKITADLFAKQLTDLNRKDAQKYLEQALDVYSQKIDEATENHTKTLTTAGALSAEKALKKFQASTRPSP